MNFSDKKSFENLLLFKLLVVDNRFFANELLKAGLLIFDNYLSSEYDVKLIPRYRSS
jgi:hypothetical protein